MSTIVLRGITRSRSPSRASKLLCSLHLLVTLGQPLNGALTVEFPIWTATTLPERQGRLGQDIHVHVKRTGMDSVSKANKWCCCFVALPPASAGDSPVPVVDAEVVKQNLLRKGASVVCLSNLANGDGIGILISKELVLTTNATILDQECAKAGTASKQKLLPDRFFVTNPEMDLTLVACEPITTDASPLMLDASCIPKQPLEVGCKVYILGHPKGSKETTKNAALGEGRIISRDDKFVRFLPDGLPWAPGSAGFNDRGQFAFVICEPKHIVNADGGQIGVSIRDVCSRMVHPSIPQAFLKAEAV